MVITAAHISPVLALLFGILILVLPRILNYLVAIYLILSGLLGLGFLAVPARADGRVAMQATAFGPNHQPIALNLVHCHDTASYGPRSANHGIPAPPLRWGHAVQTMAMVRVLDRSVDGVKDVSIAVR